MSMDTGVPWKEWGRDVMIMEILMSDPPIYTQGVRVIAVEVRSFPGGEWGTCVFIPSTSADEVVVCFGTRVVKLCGQHRVKLDGVQEH